jgi:hypothetical protein
MNKSADIFNFEKWRGIKKTLITVVLILAGCQSQVIQSTATSTLTEIFATATLLPSPTIQAPQAGALVDPESGIAVEAPTWRPPTGSEYTSTTDEPVPGYVKDFNLAGLGISVDHVDYHTNGLQGNEFQWTLTARNGHGDVMWAFDEAGNQLDYPMYFKPVKDDAGRVIRFDVTDTTPQGTKIIYEAIPDSKDADVVFVGDKLPTLVKERVTTPDGEEVFLKYFDRVKNEWVDNDNVKVTDASGNSLTWNGTEWEKTVTGWWDVEPTTDLSPSSERALELDKLELSLPYGIVTPKTFKEVEGKFALITKGGLLESVNQISIDMNGVKGDAVVLSFIVKHADGTYVRLPVFTAFQEHGADTEVSKAKLYNFPNIDPWVQPLSLPEIVELYKKNVGGMMGISTPVWDSKMGENPFDPDLYAMGVFGSLGGGSDTLPGQAKNASNNALYELVRRLCGGINACYAASLGESPSAYGDFNKLREIAKRSPFGLFATRVTKLE